MECIRQPPRNLTDHFRKTARRKVAKDRTISLNGRIFEAPVALIGKQVSLLSPRCRPATGRDSPQRTDIRIAQSAGHPRQLPGEEEQNNNPELVSTDESRGYKGGSLWGRKKDDDQ